MHRCSSHHRRPGTRPSPGAGDVPFFFYRWRRTALSLASALALSGCAGFSADGGFERVRDVARTRLDHEIVDPARTDADAIRRQVDALLAQPLSVDAAVQVALLSNRALRATYRELGIAEADLVQAGRLPNPGLEFKHTRGAGYTVIERTFVADLAALVTMPLALRVERSRFEEVQLQVGDAMLATAADTRRAWIYAVAAAQRVDYARQVVAAADAASDLATRMRAAGNWSALAAARESSFHADAIMELTRAAQAALVQRERLTRLLGLSGEAITYHLGMRLAPLPEAPATPSDAERYAMAHRLDLEADRVANRRLAQSLGLTQATRFVNAFEVARNVDSGERASGARNDGDRSGSSGEQGYEIRIEVPLFDFGDARVARAEALAGQAVERTARHAIDARSQVRERVAAYRNAWEIAQHYQTVVLPLRQRISAENLLRYNGMLIGVFELIADAREQTASVVATLDALRDFWLADADLSEALGGHLPASGSAFGIGRGDPLTKDPS